MASRPALALVRPRAPGIRRPSRAVLMTAGALLSLLGLLYLGARQSTVFAVQEVEVAGAPPRVAKQVGKVARPLVGTSLVALDGDELLARLGELPTVRSAAYDRAFPHTLAIRIEPERPLAIVRRGPGAWVVSERGRVIRRAVARDRLPRIRAGTAAELVPGASVGDAAVLVPLAALARLPEDFPVPARAARVVAGRVTIVLRDKSELRLGEGVDLGLKLTVASRVLASLSAAERAALAYLDVSLPERPVAADKSQLEG